MITEKIKLKMQGIKKFNKIARLFHFAGLPGCLDNERRKALRRGSDCFSFT